MELEEKLAAVEAELAAAKEKLASQKEFTLQDARKLIEGRDGKVFFTETAYKEAVSKEKGTIDVDAIRNAERRLVTETFAALGIEIPEKVPTDNEDGKASFKDVLKYAKTEAKNVISELKSKVGSKDEINEKLSEKEKALQLLKEELQEVKANFAKVSKDLTAKDEYSANLKKAMHEAKVSELVNSATEKELEKYTFQSEGIKSLFKKEIEAKIRAEFETDIDESGDFRVFEKFDYNGKQEKTLTKNPTESISGFIQKLEILKELTPKAKEEKASAKAPQKQVQGSNDKIFNPLTDGGETPQDAWLKEVSRLGHGKTTIEALALKPKFGIELNAYEKDLLPK